MRFSLRQTILLEIMMNMKKLTAILALCLASLVSFGQDGSFPVDTILNPSLSNFRVAASVGAESEYVFRGEKLAGFSIQPKVEFAYPVLGFDLYAGAWMNSPVNKQLSDNGTLENLEEIDLYAGVTYSWGPVTVDVGAVYYWYPSDNAGINRDYEAYTGVTFDTSAYLSGINLNPSVYYFYNFTLEQHTIEASLGYDAPVGAWLMGWEKLTMPIRAYYGYSTADKINGDQMMNLGRNYERAYNYWGASIDIAYAITEYCTVSAGVRYSQTFNANGDYDPDEDYDYSSLSQRRLWWGAKVDFGF